jgi:hypothetical protein
VSPTKFQNGIMTTYYSAAAAATIKKINKKMRVIAINKKS